LEVANKNKERKWATMNIKEVKDKRIRFECISPGVVFMLEGQLSMKIEGTFCPFGILNAVRLYDGYTHCVADHILIHAYRDAELNLETNIT
jgi:hypothetical protein